MFVFFNDVDYFGIDLEEFDIVYVVWMSMLILIFFELVVYRNGCIGEEYLIVDGGMFLNFLVWLFDCEGWDLCWLMFGLLLVEFDFKVVIGYWLVGEEYGVKRGLLFDYLKSFVLMMMEVHDWLYFEKVIFVCMIPIFMLGVGMMEFDIKPEWVCVFYDFGY